MRDVGCGRGTTDSFRSRKGCSAIVQNKTNVAMKIIRKLTEPELKIVENINRLMIEYEVRERIIP